MSTDKNEPAETIKPRELFVSYTALLAGLLAIAFMIFWGWFTNFEPLQMFVQATIQPSRWSWLSFLGWAVPCAIFWFGVDWVLSSLKTETQVYDKIQTRNVFGTGYVFLFSLISTLIFWYVFFIA